MGHDGHHADGLHRVGRGAVPRGSRVPRVLHGRAEGPHRAGDGGVPRADARRAAGRAGAERAVGARTGLWTRNGTWSGVLLGRA